MDDILVENTLATVLNENPNVLIRYQNPKAAASRQTGPEVYLSVKYGVAEEGGVCQGRHTDSCNGTVGDLVALEVPCAGTGANNSLRCAVTDSIIQKRRRRLSQHTVNGTHTCGFCD
jgi:hypothetical protein